MYYPVRTVVNPDSYIAFITGINGQDGSYLSELLLENGYHVYGIVRRNSTSFNRKNIDHILDRINVFYGDINDPFSMTRVLDIIHKAHPNFNRLEIYNLASQSEVFVSSNTPHYTIHTNINGTLSLLEYIRAQPLNIQRRIRFFQAASGDIYGNNIDTAYHDEDSRFNPMSPYACSKVAAYSLTKCYRESYKIYACNGILFNHESPRRGNNFVTKKIIDGFKQYDNDIKNNIPNPTPIVLGNIFMSRDWGHAKDYVYAMWLMMNTYYADDFVISSNSTLRVMDFIDLVAKKFDIELKWSNINSEYNVTATDMKRGHTIIKTEEQHFRKNDIDILIGNSKKIRESLGWNPEYSINSLIDDMIKTTA